MRRLTAIAGLAARSALRQRSFLAVAAALLAVVVLLPPALRDDGTAAGRARLLLTYGLGGGQALLALSALLLAIDPLGRDADRRHLWLVVTKPVPRWQVWLGQWLGLIGLQAWLVALVGLVVAAQLRVQLEAERWSPDEVARLQAEVLTARRAVPAETPDFDLLAGRRLADRLASGHLDPRPDQEAAHESIRRDILGEWQAVPAGGAKSWRFDLTGLPRTSPRVVLRYRARAAVEAPGETLRGEWTITPAGQAPRRVPAELRSGAWQLLDLQPTDLAGGALEVGYRNPTEIGLAFPLVDGPELLVTVGGFTPNLLRGLLLLWLRLAFLSALGLALGSAFSFPIALFCALACLVVALHAPLLTGVLDRATVTGLPPDAAFEELVRGLLRFGRWLAGALVGDRTVADVAGGLAITGRALAAAVGLALARIILVAAVGIGIWSSRELAGGGEG